MPPPATPAELLVKVLPLTLAVPPLSLARPPPLVVAVLLVKLLPLTLTLPTLSRPPPSVPAELRVKLLPLRGYPATGKSRKLLPFQEVRRIH